MAFVRTAGLTVIGALAFATLTASPADAQNATSGYVSFNGVTMPSDTGCPSINWRLVRTPKGAVHGYATYSDLSGVSFVKGTLDAQGKLMLKVTPTGIGDGPSGKVTGHRNKDGEVNGTLTGSGCANGTGYLPPGNPTYSPAG